MRSLDGQYTPGGHLKLPHLWPGHPPPPGWRDEATLVAYVDAYFGLLESLEQLLASRFSRVPAPEHAPTFHGHYFLAVLVHCFPARMHQADVRLAF